MYRPDERLFAFRLRRERDGTVVREGVSRRYTAVVLLALAREPGEAADEVLAGQDPQDVCGGLIEGLGAAGDLGEVALTVWAARVLRQPQAARAVDRLRAMLAAAGPGLTVELSWALASLVVSGADATDRAAAEAAAARLLAALRPASGLFPHEVDGPRRFSLRSHVACFADQVYPVQALALYSRATGNTDAVAAARRCAERVCALQGPAGQWWWHYDVRTGRVVERYPVYAVHQDAMAPMALAALRDAGGEDYAAAVEKGLEWLADPPEIEGSLIDEEAGIIWRKVARREPGKMCRAAQALASRVHRALRMPGLDALCPPTRIDYETRPYHMGWLLCALPSRPLGAG